MEESTFREVNQNDNHISNDDGDVWEDSAGADDALAIANRDWNRQIDSIQSVCLPTYLLSPFQLFVISFYFRSDK